ncbi:hypothetical protein ACFT56_13885, partial [Streptomyces cinereoruber]
EEQVAEALERAVEQTGAREVLVTTSTYDREALSASYRRLARAVGLRPRTLPEGPADRTLPVRPVGPTRPEQTPDNG